MDVTYTTSPASSLHHTSRVLSLDMLPHIHGDVIDNVLNGLMPHRIRDARPLKGGGYFYLILIPDRYRLHNCSLPTSSPQSNSPPTNSGLTPRTISSNL